MLFPRCEICHRPITFFHKKIVYRGPRLGEPLYPRFAHVTCFTRQQRSQTDGQSRTETAKGRTEKE